MERVLGTSKYDLYPMGCSGTGSLAEVVELLADSQSARLVALNAQRFSDHLWEVSHKRLFKKVIQVCLEEQCFYGASLALPFTSSRSGDTLQGQQQDCQGHC